MTAAAADNDICERLLMAVATGNHGPFGLINPDGPRAAEEIQRLRIEIARLRLADAEREAVLTLIYCGEQSEDGGDKHAADTLRSVLERTK